MRLDGAQVLVVTPAPPGVVNGNRVTAERWAARLRELGAHAEVAERWGGADADALVALHAVKSLPSIERWRAERPDAPLVIGLAGTDVYGGLDARALAGLGAADRIVALQRLAIDELPAELRPRVRVVEQSAEPAEPAERPVDYVVEALVIAHLRPVKDPLLPARAARLLPEGSRVRVTLVGEGLDAELAEAARAADRDTPSFRWIGPLPRREALARLAASDALVLPSRAEGGANVLVEAAVCGLPILATRVPGSVGLLGTDHPGLFEPGDAEGLAALLARLETDPELAAELSDRSLALAPRFAPERERAAWRDLFAEL